MDLRDHNCIQLAAQRMRVIHLRQSKRGPLVTRRFPREPRQRNDRPFCLANRQRLCYPNPNVYATPPRIH